jgi:hypothetical protein
MTEMWHRAFLHPATAVLLRLDAELAAATPGIAPG